MFTSEKLYRPRIEFMPNHGPKQRKNPHITILHQVFPITYWRGWQNIDILPALKYAHAIL